MGDSERGTLTLLSDFGAGDYYVAAMKGVILGRCREANIVDISHEVPPGDLRTAAFLLASCRRDFPPGTVHLVVVDPGVGGARKAMAAAADECFFVGPDNGVFTHVLRECGVFEAREIRERKLMRSPVSSTFHGRDIFAPAAAALARGFPFSQVGPPIERPAMLEVAEVSVRPGRVEGSILHADRFGNLISDIRAEHLERAGLTVESSLVELAGSRISRFAPSYVASPGEAFFLWSSGGYLEVAVGGGSAATVLGAARGEKITLRGSRAC